MARIIRLVFRWWAYSLVMARGGGRSRPDFGLDGPPIVYGFIALGAIGAALLAVAVSGAGSAVVVGWGAWALLLGFGMAGLMSYSSKVGKIRVRDRLLDGLHLRGDEDVLDLGCGSGLMLLGAAERAPAGTATGVDLWRSRDQAGSSRAQCLANAHLLGVADRVGLVDGDMTDLPFGESSFDLVLACLSVHNLHPSSRREKAMLEAVRVLRPGGRLALVDIYGTKTYLSVLVAAGMRQPRRSRFLGGIFPPARAVTASAP